MRPPVDLTVRLIHTWHSGLFHSKHSVVSQQSKNYRAFQLFDKSVQKQHKVKHCYVVHKLLDGMWRECFENSETVKILNVCALVFIS